MPVNPKQCMFLHQRLGRDLHGSRLPHERLRTSLSLISVQSSEL